MHLSHHRQRMASATNLTMSIPEARQSVSTVRPHIAFRIRSGATKNQVCEFKDAACISIANDTKRNPEVIVACANVVHPRHAHGMVSFDRRSG